MSEKEDNHRAHVYFGPVIEPIIKGYAIAQGVTFGTIVRRLCYMSLQSEIMNTAPDHKPVERKKEWK